MGRFVLPVGILLGTILFVFVLVRADLSTFVSVLRQADLWKVVLAQLALVTAFLFKAVRWSLLLAPISHIHWRYLVYPVVVGSAGNAIVPHSGELLRSAMVSKAWSIRVTPILTGIAIERMFDFFAVMALSVSIVFSQVMASPLTVALRFVAAGFVLLLIIFVIILIRADIVERALNWCIRFLPERAERVIRLEFRAATRTLDSLRSSHSLFRTVVLSLIQWILIGACIYVSIGAIGLDVPIGVAAGVLLLTVAGLTLPTAPGYIGTLQVCFLVGMTGYASEEQSLAASVIYNFVVTIPVILAALPAFSMLKIWSFWKTERG